MGALVRGYRVPPSVVAIGGGLGLLTLDVLAGGAHAEVVAIGLLVVVLAIWLARVAKSWTVLVAAAALVVLLIPNNGSYILPEALPFKLEPYRVLVGLLLIGWIVSLLVDPRVRARASGFGGPLAAIIGVVLVSDLANPARVGSTSSYVIKALWLFFTFVLFYYMVVSVVRTRAMVERIITVFVSAGTIVGLAAIVQRRSGYDVFDHLHALLPMFHYVPAAAAAIEERGGHLRAFASSGHPIELSTVMAMIIPFAAYLAITRKQRAWWLAAVAMLLGDFAGGSRTGIIGVLVLIAVFLWLRPRQTLRCWPALIPLLVILHFAAPGALGGLEEEFFPQGGIVQQQSETEIGPHGEVVYSSRLSRIGPEMHEYLKHDPLVGQGYGTRVTGLHQPNADNAIVLDDEWLDTLLEVGLIGVLAWVWLFGLAIRRLGVRAKLERNMPEGWLPVAIAASIATFASSMFFFDAFGYVQATFMAFLQLALAAVVLHLPVNADAAAATTASDLGAARETERTQDNRDDANAGAPAFGTVLPHLS
jgi:polysaccharide biosynthesis protein PslJ